MHTQIATLLPPLVLGLALAAAVWHDVKARRIPNSLILASTPPPPSCCTWPCLLG
ncbi:hypothetical protein LP420_31125 [Massilia sp. B-10]|nr:hypothetical protein LP420_31125 [Massilia sp. B-10]